MNKKVFALSLTIYAAFLSALIHFVAFVAPQGGLLLFTLGAGYQFLLVRYKEKCVAGSLVLVGLLMLLNVSLGGSLGIFMLMIGFVHGIALALFGVLGAINIKAFSIPGAQKTLRKPSAAMKDELFEEDPILDPALYNEPFNIYYDGNPR